MSTSTHSVYGYIAGALMIVGMVPYVYSIIFSKTTKLNRASWGIWFAVSVINLAAYLVAGEKESACVPAVGTVNCLILFGLSFKYGEKKWYRSDTVCVLLAIASLIIWKLTNNPVLALVAGLSADGLGVIPTLIKIKKDPFSENIVGWLFGFIASAINIFAVKDWTWANGVYISYMFVSFIVILVPLIKGQWFTKPKPIEFNVGSSK